MEHSNQTTRKNFVRRGAAFAALLLAAAIPFAVKKKKTKTIKFLTQDGKLVEIDEQLISATRKKITDEELKNWVTKK